MKSLFLLVISQFFIACLMSPQPMSSQRRVQPEVADADTLDMLVLNEREYQSQRSLASNDDLRLGMPARSVESSLGQPNQVEVAGNPKYGNERWTYERAFPTSNGYYSEKKVIYFEAGSVVGWESQ